MQVFVCFSVHLSLMFGCKGDTVLRDWEDTVNASKPIFLSRGFIRFLFAGGLHTNCREATGVTNVECMCRCRRAIKQSSHVQLRLSLCRRLGCVCIDAHSNKKPELSVKIGCSKASRIFASRFWFKDITGHGLQSQFRGGE